MLKIIYGNYEKAIYNTAVYFKNTYTDEWITDPMSAEMILDIDKSEVKGAHLIESPVLGPISPKELSGGVKTLILVHKDKEHIFNASTCQELYRIYGDYQFGKKFNPEMILVEDSNAGFEFFAAYSDSQKWSVKSADGKSNVFQKIKCLQDKKLLVIADGAAFGPEMERVIQKIEGTDGVAIYYSFDYRKD